MMATEGMSPKTGWSAREGVVKPYPFQPYRKWVPRASPAGIGVGPLPPGFR